MTASRHSGVLVHAVFISFDVEVIPITVVCSSLASAVLLFIISLLFGFNYKLFVCVLIFLT